MGLADHWNHRFQQLPDLAHAGHQAGFDFFHADGIAATQPCRPVNN